jgi:hypothetical protein
MITEILHFIASFFETFNAISVALAVLFGVIWMACFRPPLFSKFWLWAILPFGAMITLLAVAVLQLPFQSWIEHVIQAPYHDEHHIMPFLLAALPVLVVSALVQEGAKLVPAVTYWQLEKRKINPVLGMQIGAVAGAGFGMLQAQWVHNAIFASGWTFEMVQIEGIGELFVFYESVFIVAMHVTTAALSGYGLAKGWGWQFYLLASLIHIGMYTICFLIHAHFIPHVMGELAMSLYIEAIMVAVIIVGERSTKRAEHDEVEQTES